MTAATGFLTALILSSFTLLSGSTLSAALAPLQVPSTAQVSREAAELVLTGFDQLGQGKANEAEATFRKAIEARPEAEAAHRGLGLSLRDEGKLEDALRELQTATRLDPNDVDAHYALGITAWTLSEQGGGKQGRVRLSPSDLRGLAGEEFRKVLELHPTDVSLRMNLAGLYLDAGRVQEAQAQAQEAVRLAPTNSTAHVLLGRADFAGGEEEKAASEFASALKLDPSDGSALLALGDLRLFQRRFREAEEAFRGAIKVSPNLAPAYGALAQILIHEGRNGEARGLLEKAVALSPQDWESQFQLARLLSQAGEDERATELYRTTARLHPDFLAAREQLALGLLRRRDIEGADTQAEAMIAQKPQGAEGHRVKALVLWKQRDWEESLAECALALASDPESASMLTLQAIGLWKLDRKKDAQQAFRQAAKIEPKVASADVFCRLLLCDARDISSVSEFLRKNRWVLAPPPPP